ncbi:hypothetical protein HDU76_013337 [Blyttiomyces sp. JEL0837]|nr:hypothetical protein HDU76_013337 [Blyttiomyces sp. JEL0837]
MELELNERAVVEQILRDENEYMNIFREITHLVRHSLDRNVILQTGAREICDRFKARRCLLYLPVSNNPENTQLRCVAEVVRRTPILPPASGTAWQEERSVSTETIYESDVDTSEETDSLLFVGVGSGTGGFNPSERRSSVNASMNTTRVGIGHGRGPGPHSRVSGSSMATHYLSDLLDEGTNLAGVILDHGIPCVQNAIEAGVTVPVCLDNCQLGKRYGFPQREINGFRGGNNGIEISPNSRDSLIQSSRSLSEIAIRRKRQTAWMARIDLGGVGRSGLIVLIGPEDAYVDMSDLEPGRPNVGVVDDGFDVVNGGGSVGGDIETGVCESRGTLVNGGGGGVGGSHQSLFSKMYGRMKTSASGVVGGGSLGNLNSSTQGHSQRVPSSSMESLRNGTTVGLSTTVTAIGNFNDNSNDDRDMMARSVARRSMLLLCDTAEQMGIALQQAVVNEQEKLRIVQLAEKNQALMQARKEVEVAQAHKDFTAVMSHEMRTPLFAISSLTAMILEMPAMLSSEDPDVQEAVNFLGVIKKSAQMLITIVNNILDFAKYEDNDFALDRNAFDLRNAFETAAEIVAMQDQTDAYPVILTFLDPNVPEVVVGDETRFRQIVINLVANACKFTKSDVYDESGTASKWRLNVSVRDTGIGIKADDADKLFQRFTQADTSITRKYGGTGLGLSIAKDLCHMMGGKINVRPNPHGAVGTEFTFSVLLEVYKPEEWPGVSLPTSLELLKLKEVDAQRVNVAVVDGNVKTAEELEELLKTCGVTQFTRFSTLQYALAASQTSSPTYTAIIIDYRTIIQNNETVPLHNLTCTSEFGSRFMIICNSQQTREYRRNRHRGDLGVIVTRPPKLHLVASFLHTIKGGGFAPFPLNVVPGSIAAAVTRTLKHSELAALNAPNHLGDVMPKADVTPRLGRRSISGQDESTTTISSSLSTVSTTAGPDITLTVPGHSKFARSSAHSPIRRSSDGEVVLPPGSLSSQPKPVLSDSRNPTSEEFHAIPAQPFSPPLPPATKVAMLVPSSPTASAKSAVVSQRCEDVLPQYHILVVEDNKVNQLVIGKMLSKLGQKYEVADDGVFALEKLLPQDGHSAYDIVFMDIMMPRKDGYQATQELREATKDSVRPWVIGLSANAFWDNKVRAMESGMNDFICKPCTLDDLRGALNRFGKMQFAT